MKILLDDHMLEKEQTGIGRYFKNLNQFLRKERTVELISYNNKQLNPLFSNGLYRIFFGFNHLINKHRPDILHVSNFCPIIKNLPVVTTIHDLCFKFYPRFFSKKSLFAFNLFLKNSLERSDAIICVSNTVKNYLIKLYSINENKLFVIYHAPDPVFGHIKNKSKIKEYLKKRFNLNNDYFLVVGNVERRKNPIPVIEAFLAQNNENLSLVFAGPNRMPEELQTKYASLIKNNKIRFLNYLKDEELNFLYNGTLALIYNSLCEGFGIPLVEAMRCKTPIICSDLEVFHEIASDSAIFTKNQSDLAHAMHAISKQKGLKLKLGQKAYERGRNFSWHKAAKQTLGVYKWVSKKSFNHFQ